MLNSKAAEKVTVLFLLCFVQNKMPENKTRVCLFISDRDGFVDYLIGHTNCQHRVIQYIKIWLVCFLIIVPSPPARMIRKVRIHRNSDIPKNDGWGSEESMVMVVVGANSECFSLFCWLPIAWICYTGQLHNTHAGEFPLKPVPPLLQKWSFVLLVNLMFFLKAVKMKSWL